MSVIQLSAVLEYTLLKFMDEQEKPKRSLQYYVGVIKF